LITPQESIMWMFTGTNTIHWCTGIFEVCGKTF